MSYMVCGGGYLISRRHALLCLSEFSLGSNGIYGTISRSMVESVGGFLCPSRPGSWVLWPPYGGQDPPPQVTRLLVL